MTTMLAAVIGAVIGAAATLAAGWWARQAGRAADQRASAAEDRARLAEHRAAVTALLAAAYPLDTLYEHCRPGNGDAITELATRLRLAASRVAWPVSSPMSAQAAEAVYVFARLAFVPPCKIDLSAAGPWGLQAFRHALRMFDMAAEIEAGCYRARRPSAGHVAMQVAFIAEGARQVALIAEGPRMQIAIEPE